MGAETDVATVTVVTPTYEEAGNIGRHVAAVLAQGPGYRIVVVDDASPDGTGNLVDALAQGAPGRIEVVHRPGKAGLGSAYVAGIRRALDDGTQCVALMDADGSHDPEALPRLVAATTEADVVLGSRYCAGGSTPGWPAGRRTLSRLGGLYAAAVLGLPVADPTSGFRVMRRESAEAIDLDAIMAAGFAVNLELTWRLVRAGCRIAEEPIAFRDRLAGRSKMSPAIAAEAAVLVWRLRLANTASRFDSNNRSARPPNPS